MEAEVFVRHASLVIGIPVFNEAKYLSHCLDSLVDQKDKNFSVFISDNGSTDGSYEIAKDYSNRFENFTTVRQSTNIGSMRNFVFLLQNSQSPFFQWLGSHDFLGPDYVKKVMMEFERRPNAALIYTRTQWVDENNVFQKVTDGGGFASCERITPIQRYITTVAGPWKECTAVNGVFNRDAIKQTRPHLFRGPDHLILSRAQIFGPVGHIPVPLYCRRHFSSRTTTQAERLYPLSTPLKRNVQTIWPLICWHVRDFFSLRCSAAEKLKYFPKFLRALESGYYQHFPYYSLLRHGLRRVFDGIKKWK